MLSKIARLGIVLIAIIPAAAVVYVLCAGLSDPVTTPLTPAEPVVDPQPAQAAQLQIDAESPWDALAKAASNEEKSTANWMLLGENRPIHERRKTLTERKMFDRRTIIGDRPQDWHAAWSQRFVLPSQRGRFDPKTGATQRYDRTTRVWVTPVGRYAQTGYKSRLGELMRAGPRTSFLEAYQHPNGTYFRSSMIRQARFNTPLHMQPSSFGMQQLTNDAGKYVFNQSNYAQGQSFMNSYLTGTPTFAPSFYYRTQLGEFRTKLAQRWLRQATAISEAYYGRRERAAGWQARQMPVTLETIPLYLQRRVPGVVYFRDRGYGTYNREYYSPPVPRIYRNSYQRLMTHPVAHSTPFTAP